MKSYRGNAIAAGVLFILCSAASILSIVPLGSAATGTGIVIALYPLLRLFNPALALGAVAGRAVENVFVLVGTLSLLALLTVSQQAAGSADPSSFLATGDALVAAREWAHGFVAIIPFGIGSLLFSLVLYRSRLVPRWLSGWGLVAAALSLVATVYAGFTQDFGFTTANTVLSAPIGLQEMVLAVWLIVKGFNPSVVRSIAPTDVRSTTP